MQPVLRPDFRRQALTCVLLAAVAGCQADAPKPTEPSASNVQASVNLQASGGSVATVTISPSPVMVELSGVQTAVATARDANGNPIPGATFNWSISNTQFAVFQGSSQGVSSVTVRGTLVGQTYLHAFLQSNLLKRAKAPLDVTLNEPCIAASWCFKASSAGQNCSNEAEGLLCSAGYTCDPTYPCNAETFPNHPNPHALCCRPPEGFE